MVHGEQTSHLARDSDHFLMHCLQISVVRGRETGLLQTPK